MIREEDLVKQAKEIESEIASEKEEERANKRFYRALVAVFMAGIIILMVVPFYAVKHNPEPGPVSSLDVSWKINQTSRIASIDDIYDLEITSVVRGASIQITSRACKGSDICNAKALFYYVRDNIRYLPDPPYEYIQSPDETLMGAGDCEDQAILLAYLLKSVGIRSRLVLIPGHAYVEAWMPDAPRKYQSDGWVAMDATCSSCGFGEVATPSVRKSYVDV